MDLQFVSADLRRAVSLKSKWKPLRKQSNTYVVFLRSGCPSNSIAKCSTLIGETTLIGGIAGAGCNKTKRLIKECGEGPVGDLVGGPVACSPWRGARSWAWPTTVTLRAVDAAVKLVTAGDIAHVTEIAVAESAGTATSVPRIANFGGEGGSPGLPVLLAKGLRFHGWCRNSQTGGMVIIKVSSHGTPIVQTISYCFLTKRPIIIQPGITTESMGCAQYQ